MSSLAGQSVTITSSRRSGGISQGCSRQFPTHSVGLIRSAAPACSYSSRSLQGYGARQTRISTGGYAGGLGAGFGAGSSSFMVGGLGGNEKDTMQNLNNRMSVYMEQVRSLEQANMNLEKEIREFASSRSFECFDWSIYDSTIKPLQQQILNGILQNSHISLETDNAKLAAQDFKNKWESELMLRQSVEADINGLHQLKDTYLQLQSNLALDITSLEDEIAFLKKNHAEELRQLRQQKTQDIQVEVDAAPSVDLTEALKQMRDAYTKMADANQKDLDVWYNQQVQIQTTQVAQNTQAVTGGKTELAGLRQQLQTLEAEWNSLSGTIAALQNSLDNTELRYRNELQRLLNEVGRLEGELAGLINGLKIQSQEYEALLNEKMRLEAEIHKYRILLDGGQKISSSASYSSSSSSGSGLQSGMIIKSTTHT
ncbi:keratin, type I cytoskeletal 19-like [Mustelus asterias]